MDEPKARRPLAVVTGASIGFEAMCKGEADVVAGLKNKLEVAISKVMPAQAVAQRHRKLAEPKGQA